MALPDSMKAAVHTDALFLDIQDRDIPPITQPDHVLVRVAAVGICGSDKHDLDHPPRQPQVPGHEFSGWVAETGGQAGGFSEGDPVLVRPLARCGQCEGCLASPKARCTWGGVYGCRGNNQPPGAMAQYVRVLAENLTRVPEGISLEEAALADPLAVAIHAIRCGPDVRGRACVVLGAGVIGLLMAQVLKLRGAGQVVLVDIQTSHLKAASMLGDFTLLDSSNRDEVTRTLSSLNCGIYYELAGGEAPTLDIAIDAIARHGWILLVSQRPGGSWINYQHVLFKQLTLRGIAGIGDEAWAEAEQLIFGRKLHLQPLITHRFPLESATEALRVAVEGESLKVMLHPNGDSRKC